jgi:hypothetical protein
LQMRFGPGYIGMYSQEYWKIPNRYW